MLVAGSGCWVGGCSELTLDTLSPRTWYVAVQSIDERLNLPLDSSGNTALLSESLTR